MIVAGYGRLDDSRERAVLEAFAHGVRAFGDEFRLRERKQFGSTFPEPGVQAVFMYGVKSLRYLRRCHEAGIAWGILDKSYLSNPLGGSHWTRVSINELYPVHHFRTSPSPGAVRWEVIANQTFIRLGVTPRPFDASWALQAPILIAGSSQKLYDFLGMGDEREVHRELVRQLRAVLATTHDTRQIFFRPKPSYEKRHRFGVDDLNVDGFSTPGQAFSTALEHVGCVVTVASNAAVESLLRGVPTVVLGPHVAATVTATTLDAVLSPSQVPRGELMAWCARLGHELWMLEEFSSGEAWRHLRQRARPPNGLWPETTL